MLPPINNNGCVVSHVKSEPILINGSTLKFSSSRQDDTNNINVTNNTSDLSCFGSMEDSDAFKSFTKDASENAIKF